MQIARCRACIIAAEERWMQEEMWRPNRYIEDPPMWEDVYPDDRCFFDEETGELTHITCKHLSGREKSNG